MKIVEQNIQIQSQTLRTKHIYLDQTNTASPTLVFLHEGLGCLELWKDFPEKLCEACGLNGFVYERVGFGKSSPLGLVPRPLDYLEREGRDVLPSVLTEAGIKNPFLIGHSDGGSIALVYAAHYPHSLSGAITEAAHVFVEDVTLKGIRDAGELYFKADLKSKLERYHGDNTDKAFRGWYETWLTPAFAHWNMENLLPNIECPLLVIQGIEDEYGTQKQVQSIVENSSGAATPLMVPDCAHIPHHQSQETVLKAMADFIQKHA
ncbi:alpha/beta hydrolase [Terasakiella sp. SH-1]|uniref:alpha/beta fold hydrolase n=1 Tax=Terasakiella sp. SH-1 TaxID=2560057 RepID=UPI001073FFD0|nr:alpha/beta hydrolase [Terasakiella sp. SH-1]